MSVINILIEEKYYTKDPQSSELGRNIISASIELLDELGFEEFTFKKLAERINSTEASVYRYFDNKLRLLVYLTTCYWAWMEYMIDYKTHFINDSQQKLREILKIICHNDNNILNIDMPGVAISKLRRVVGNESDKTYLTKKVDQINNEGLFMGYKKLCNKIAMIIQDINPDYPYSHAIVSTLIEASHQQAFFALHLASLTEIDKNGESIDDQINRYLEDTLLKLIL
ncbi:MAG: AcrR family transcriptional regulator [Cyclobacteriaceae bacterium]|jgi:AcrR family transcriptional regulator